MKTSACAGATTMDLDHVVFSPAAAPEAGGTLVFKLSPIARFLAALKPLLGPGHGRVTCAQDDDADTYVEVAVPDGEWERFLGERMSGVTLDILRDTGDYVGLITVITPSLSPWRSTHALE